MAKWVRTMQSFVATHLGVANVDENMKRFGALLSYQRVWLHGALRGAQRTCEHAALELGLCEAHEHPPRL